MPCDVATPSAEGALLSIDGLREIPSERVAAVAAVCACCPRHQLRYLINLMRMFDVRNDTFALGQPDRHKSTAALSWPEVGIPLTKGSESHSGKRTRARCWGGGEGEGGTYAL